MIIACPHCAGLNRLPATRLSQQPVCGKCKLPMFVGQPVTVTADNFANLAEKSDLPLVLDFWADWCGPCRSFAPVFSQAAAELEPMFRFGKINTEVEQVLAGRFQIRSIPTLMLLHKGRVVAQLAGALPKAQFYRWLQQQAANLQQADERG